MIFYFTVIGTYSAFMALLLVGSEYCLTAPYVATIFLYSLRMNIIHKVRTCFTTFCCRCEIYSELSKIYCSLGRSIF